MTEEALLKLQKAMSLILEKREEALSRPCPFCFGTLVIADIAGVKCSGCGQVYSVDKILQGG